MTTTLKTGDKFPDFTLRDHTNHPARLSSFVQPSLYDKHLGFNDGYPVILIFGRGFFCPRDQEQLRQLTGFQSELKVNYGKLLTVNVDPPLVNAAFRAGLGATWPFLSDENREIVREINILDETEGEYAYRAQPYTFILQPDLTIYKIYNGWFFVGRPTVEELRYDLRTIMEDRSDYRYEAYDTPAVRQVRIPQQEWANGAPALGANGLVVASGVVRWFDLNAGYGEIERDGDGTPLFFNFTAIPGEGYRTLRVGTPVRFEVIEHPNGPVARNIQSQTG